MNRIQQLFNNKSGNILSVYFTAGFPTIGSTVEIIRSLAAGGADMIEVGIPFSDPMADGPVIQKSSDIALKNGMNLKLLFQQLKDIRREVSIPLLMMGYLNPALQFGMDRFCRQCAEVGIDGIILPDLPLDVYLESYQGLFQENNLYPVFLISPQTSDERILSIDRVSEGFIYMVSASSTTGTKDSFSAGQMDYFERLSKMNLKNPRMIGFGISTHDNFTTVCKYAQGAIIGSAFIKALEKEGDMKTNILNFCQGILK